MTEADWLACADPTAMLGFLRGKVSDRKQRLFACDCCRRITPLLPDNAYHKAALLGERIADGVANESEARSAAEEIRWAVRNYGDGFLSHNFSVTLAYAAVSPYHPFGYLLSLSARETAVLCTADGETEEGSLLEELESVQPALLRDIFGNPFRPMPTDPRWLTSTAVSLAQSIYADRAFDRLPILADALEDAGCDDADLLTHCRGDGPHVRGCWAVDLILGKS